ncbi:ABC transporter substrate-binding protein [Actinocorallia libanotica]|uniref:ABC transporter substrate-binding protein n=1 Tax=Actinocorallia libanotica TaxID=46162 RepID=A0ABN1Q4S6_9ACTN
MTGRRPLSLLPALVCAALVSACGGGSAGETGTEAPAARGFPVTVSNCGVTTTYERAPRRAVTMNQHVTEVLLALGLEKSMVGTAFLDDAILPEYKAAYDGVKAIADEYPSYETLLAAEPDFVYGGFTSAFDEKEGRGRERLSETGIDSYLDVESCPSGPVTMATLEQEIRNVAGIFGVRERGERELERLHGVLDSVAGRLEGVDPARVFVYDSGDKTAFTAGGAGIGNEMIELAGGENLFADVDKAFADVSFEQVAERAPEVIVIYDYGGQSVEDKKRFLLADPVLKDVPAIREQRFAVLPLSSAVLGVRAPAGVDSLARQIHPDRFR